MTALCNGANVWSSEKSRSTLLVWCVTDWKVRCATPQASWSTQNLPTGCWVTSLKLGSAVKNIGRQGQTAVPKLTNWHWSQTATTSPSHAYLGGLTAVHLKGGIWQMSADWDAAQCCDCSWVGLCDLPCARARVLRWELHMGDLVSYDEPVLEAICQGRAGVPQIASWPSLDSLFWIDENEHHPRLVDLHHIWLEIWCAQALGTGR